MIHDYIAFLDIQIKYTFNIPLTMVTSCLVTSSDMIIVSGVNKDGKSCILNHKLDGTQCTSQPLSANVSYGGSAEITWQGKQCIVLAYNIMLVWQSIYISILDCSFS